MTRDERVVRRSLLISLAAWIIPGSVASGFGLYGYDTHKWRFDLIESLAEGVHVMPHRSFTNGGDPDLAAAIAAALGKVPFKQSVG